MTAPITAPITTPTTAHITIPITAPTTTPIGADIGITGENLGQEEMHRREKKEMLKKSEEPKIT